MTEKNRNQDREAAMTTCVYCSEREAIDCGLCRVCLWDPERQVQALKDKGRWEE